MVKLNETVGWMLQIRASHRIRSDNLRVDEETILEKTAGPEIKSKKMCY